MGCGFVDGHHILYLWKNLHNLVPLNLKGFARNDNFWVEDGPSEITPVDMDTGNPWDSAAPVAPNPETAFGPRNEASAAAGSSDWAAFNESEMKPVESAVEAAPAEAAPEASEPEAAPAADNVEA